MTSATPYTEAYISGPQKTLFFTRTYLPPTSPKAILVFFHGFNEHIARYTHVHTPVSQRGIAVFTMDQRGFGETVYKKENGAGKKYAQTSWREQLEDMEWAVKEARKVEGCADVPLFVMGHSMVRLSLSVCISVPMTMFLNGTHTGWRPRPRISDSQRA